MLAAKLSDKANSLELAEEQMWQIWCSYQNIDWAGTIDYPDTFNVRDRQRDLEMIINAQTIPVQSETLKREMHKQLAELIVNDDNTLIEIRNEIDAAPTGEMEMPFEPHIMIDPETGERRTANTQAEHLELAAQGWIHE